MDDSIRYCGLTQVVKRYSKVNNYNAPEYNPAEQKLQIIYLTLQICKYLNYYFVHTYINTSIFYS